MNSSGSPDVQQANDNAPAAPSGDSEKRGMPIALLIIGLAAVLLAGYIGVNVIGVLYSMVAPPAPPLPAGMTEVSHVQKAYGVDAWVYRSADDGCDLMQAYMEVGMCHPAPMMCGALRQEPTPNLPREIVARCSGEQSFSIFVMQWNNYIFRRADGTSEVEVEREVFWIGTGRD
jgi:hypothetical protein